MNLNFNFRFNLNFQLGPYLFIFISCLFKRDLGLYRMGKVKRKFHKLLGLFLTKESSFSNFNGLFIFISIYLKPGTYVCGMEFAKASNKIFFFGGGVVSET